MNKLIKLAGVVLFALTVFVSSTSILSPAIAAGGPFKMKGFYMGMSIEEARDRLAELSNDKEIMIEENAEGPEKVFFIQNVWKIKKEDFKQAYDLTGFKGADVLWKSLIDTGYLNESGRIQNKFIVIEKPAQIEFSPGANKHKDFNADLHMQVQVNIYSILKAAGMQPKFYYKIFADNDKKVKYIYFSGGATDKLFNTEGVDPKIFRKNFTKAYIKDCDLVSDLCHAWDDYDLEKAEKVYLMFQDLNLNGCKIKIFSDKSLSLERVTEDKDFKFD
jgi:hypothetical protein